MNYLPIAWAGIIGFCIIMYVVLDGFTLGTGMMMALLNKSEKDIAMGVILPNWDGNQTWLVLGMASLYGAFPLAFSILLPTLYIPLLLMVVCLLFRGVIFEFRLKSNRGRKGWDILFTLSCVFVTMIQGTILGNFIHGFDHHEYVWLNSFSLLCGVSLVFGYALLGATRLILKTTGKIQNMMYKASYYLMLIQAISLVLVSLASLRAHPDVAHLWLNQSNWHYLFVFPLVSIACFILLVYGLMKKKEHLPYWSTVIIFLCCYAGFIADVFPYIVPYHITLYEAASPPSTLRFIFVGAVVMIPVLLIYTGYSYRIFRGKTNEAIHY